MHRSGVMVLLLASFLAALPAQKRSFSYRFQEALDLMGTKGDYAAAVRLFEEIAKGSERSLAARALVYAGMCYEKLGREKARKAYQEVIDKYPGEREAVGLARRRLARLNNLHPGARTMTVREFLHSDEGSADKINDPMDFNFVITGEGQTLVYTDWWSGDLVVKNFPTGKAYGLYNVKVGPPDYFPVLSPGDNKVAYLHERYTAREKSIRVCIDSLEGGNRETVYELDLHDQSRNDVYLHLFDWSPDGNHILAASVARDRSISLVTIGVKDKKISRLITLNWENPLRAQYSPDGEFIAYDSTKGGERKIYLLRAKSLEEHVLVDSPGEDDSPVWTRDGRFLVFRSSRSGDWDVYAQPMKGGQPGGDPVLVKSNIGSHSALRGITADERLFYAELWSGSEIVILEREKQGGKAGEWRRLPRVHARHEASPGLAPDGAQLAYLTSGPSQVALRIARPEGTILKEKSFQPDFPWIAFPRFSPDGKKIALAAQDAQGRSRVLLLSADTGEVLRVFTAELRQIYTFPCNWSPDSRRIYVRKGSPEGWSLEALNVETGETTEVALSKKTGGWIFVSPDEQYLLFNVNVQDEPGPEERSELWVRSMTNGREKMVLKELGFWPLVWDFDSRHAFYKKASDLGKDKLQRLYRISVETGLEEVFLENAKNLGWFDVSRDGKYMAFQKDRLDMRIWVLENFLPKSNVEPTRR